MKDLITTIGAMIILMVFMMQFCLNQIIASRVLIADKIVDEIGKCKVDEMSLSRIEDYKVRLSNYFKCDSSEVIIHVDDDSADLQIPIKEVIACGDFLGISDVQNKATYKREILLR